MVSASTTASNCAQLLRQCEALKLTILGKSHEATSILSDEFVSRQRLEAVYKSLLLTDVQFALDNKVELELWNYAFKGHIDTLRYRIKEKKVTNEKSELQVKLSLFIDSSSGFYFQLLQEFCDRYDLDLPYHGKANQLGILTAKKKLYHGSKPPKMNSCLYICQDCLVHLGDLARYRNDLQQAIAFYELAAKILPGNGQPYNQLAILASARNNSLQAVFYYLKSISVPNPFPAASSNLLKTFSQVCSKPTYSILAKPQGVTAEEFLDLFLQLVGCIYLQQDSNKSVPLAEKTLQDLKEVLLDLSECEIILMAGVCVFVLSKHKRNNNMVLEEEMDAWRIIVNLSFGILYCFVECTVEMFSTQQIPITQMKCMPGIKVLCDWLFCNNIVEDNILKERKELYYELMLLGNMLLSVVPEMEKTSVPLMEDWQMHGVLGLRRIHKRYDFKIQYDKSSDEEVWETRGSRLLQFLDWMVLQSQHSRYISKDEHSGEYTCSFQLSCNDLNISMKGLLEALPVNQPNNNESRCKSPFPDKSRSLFRTDSEDCDEMVRTPVASYSLFDTMWNEHPKETPATLAPLIFPVDNSVPSPSNYRSTNGDSFTLKQHSSASGSAVQSPMSPLQHNPPALIPRPTSQYPHLLSQIAPGYIARPYIGDHSPSFGVIGQTPTRGAPPGMLQHVRQTFIPVVQSNGAPQHWVANEAGPTANSRSIWSSNFAMGQGALSPLEQLLQEQRRHQRPK